MEIFNNALPVILYILLTILVVILIIFFIRLFKTLKKVDQVMDDISKRVTKFDNVFSIIDKTTDTLAEISDNFTGFIVNKVIGLFTKKMRKKEEDEDE